MDYELSDHAAKRMTERRVKPQWIEATLAAPDLEEPDRVDSTVKHALKQIAEMENRVLRVIYDPKRSPRYVISAYLIAV